MSEELLINPESMNYSQCVEFLKEIERARFDHSFSNEMNAKYNITENNIDEFNNIKSSIERFVGTNTPYSPNSLISYWINYVRLEERANEKILLIADEKERYLWEHCGKELFAEAEDRKIFRNRRANKLNLMKNTGCLLAILIVVVSVVLEIFFKGSGIFAVFSIFSIVLAVSLPWLSIGTWIYSLINPEAFKVIPENLESLRKIDEMNERLIEFEIYDDYLIARNDEILEISESLARERYENYEIYIGAYSVLGNINQLDELSEIIGHINLNPYDAKDLSNHEQLRYHTGKARQKYFEKRKQEHMHNEQIRALDRKTEATNKLIEEMKKPREIYIKNK
ncbi:hypothetical protein [Macrococcus equi]|uniref:hypothetical protein n=1 Tax=Macrococcus equi TaxID=3395462 RepID=UPI0039BE0F2A